MSKATIEQLGVLHALACQWAHDKLTELEPINVMTEAGPVFSGQWRRAAKAADFAAVVKFLNDNSITADIDKNKGLNGLRDELKNQQRHSDKVVTLPTAQQAAAGIKEVKYAGQ